MNFASDNVYGIHPRILAAISEANSGTAPSYASDDYSKRAEEKLGEIFEKPVRAFLVTTGTAANVQTIYSGLNNIVTINGGGTLTLTGTNTLTSLVFNNSGGGFITRTLDT